MSISPSSSDEELLKQYQQGDARAFHTFVERYATSIYNLAYRLVRERMEAENITQETFLRIVTSLDRIRLDEPIKPYLFSIAFNLCRDLARKKLPVLFADLSRTEPEPADEESIIDETPEPWEKIAEAELQTRLREAVKQLPGHYRTVVLLRYSEDFSYEEIAKTLNLPLNTVRTYLRRAKQQLRRALGSEQRNE
jgi:RNA polymerase sigma-70 factor (ECF subfamily)